MGAGCGWLLSGDATGTEIYFFKADGRRVLDGRRVRDGRRVLDGRRVRASDGVLVITTEGAVDDGVIVGIPEGAADDKVGVGTTVEVGTAAVGSSVG